MKIRNVGLNTLFYFLYMFGACFVTMLAEALLVYIIERFVILSYPALTVIRIVIYSAGVPVIMGVMGRFEGYRESYCSVGETVLSGGLALVVHLLFAMLFHFQAFVSGAVRFTAGLMHNGWGITYDSLINETPYSLFLLVFAAYGILYVAVLTVTKYLGAQKRIMDRAELRRGEDVSAAEEL